MEIRFKGEGRYGLGAMSMSVDINPSTHTVTATRSIRKSGSSFVLTIPPEIMQSLDLDEGEKMRLEGNWETGDITVEQVD